MGKAFYSTDDGKTWFVDDASHIPPFDYDGATAYQAQIFKCAHGGQFIAYLQSYSAADKEKIEKAIADGQSGTDVRGLELILGCAVKKPGESNWVKNTPASSALYAEITKLTCPDGTGDGLEKVDPN